MLCAASRGMSSFASGEEDHGDDLTRVRIDDEQIVLDHHIIVAAILGDDFHDRRGHGDEMHGRRDARADIDREMDIRARDTRDVLALDHRLDSRLLAGVELNALPAAALLGRCRTLRTLFLAALFRSARALVAVARHFLAILAFAL